MGGGEREFGDFPHPLPFIRLLRKLCSEVCRAITTFILVRFSMSSRLRWSKKVSVEHMRRIRRKRLNGMALSARRGEYLNGYHLLVL